MRGPGRGEENRTVPTAMASRGVGIFLVIEIWWTSEEGVRWGRWSGLDVGGVGGEGGDDDWDGDEDGGSEGVGIDSGVGGDWRGDEDCGSVVVVEEEDEERTR